MPTQGDLCELAVVYDAGGADRFLNVFGFVNTDGLGDFAGLAADFKTGMVKNTSGGLLYTCHQTYGTSLIRVRDVVPGTGAGYDYSFTRVAGNVATGTLGALNVAAVIKWNSALSGRSYRGRSYIAGFPSASAQAGIWESSVVTAMGSLITSMIAFAGPSGTLAHWQFVAISRVHNKAPRAQPIGTAILTGTARSTIYSQRRRELGVGS